MTNCEIMTIKLKTDSDSGQIDLGGPNKQSKMAQNDQTRIV